MDREVYQMSLCMEQDGEKGGGRETGPTLQGAANAYLIKAPQAENPNMQRTIVTNLVLSRTIMLSPKY